MAIQFFLIQQQVARPPVVTALVALLCVLAFLLDVALGVLLCM